MTAASRLVRSLSERMRRDVANFPEGDQREALVTELVGSVFFFFFLLLLLYVSSLNERMRRDVANFPD